MGIIKNMMVKKIIRQVQINHYFDLSKFPTLKEDDLFIVYKNKVLLQYILEGISSIQIDKLLSSITKKNEVIDVLISIKLHDKICKLNPQIIDNMVKDNSIIEKYINNDYVFIELMKLIRDKKVAYELCEKYNKKQFLNLIFEDKFIEKLEEKKYDDYLKPNFFADEKKESLDSESVELLNEFIMLFEKELNKEQLNFIYNSFYQSLIFKNPNVKSMLNNLINIKKSSPDLFKYTFIPLKKSECRLRKVNIASNNLAPVVLFHENGHLLHEYNDNMNIDNQILNEIMRIRSNPQKNMSNFAEFKKLYENCRMEAYQEAQQYFKKYYSSINHDFEHYLMQLNLPNYIIGEIKNITDLEERFLRKQEQIIYEQYVYQYLLKKYPEILQISDILDAILSGNVSCFSAMHGHGEDYYSEIKKCFNEIVACFVSLNCLPKSKEYLEMLKGIIGEEIFVEIEQYCNKILNPEKTLDQQKSM